VRGSKVHPSLLLFLSLSLILSSYIPRFLLSYISRCMYAYNAHMGEIINSHFSLTFLISHAFANRHIVDILLLLPRTFRSHVSKCAHLEVPGRYIIQWGKGSRRSLLQNLYLTIDSAIGHDFALPYDPSLRWYRYAITVRKNSLSIFFTNILTRHCKRTIQVDFKNLVNNVFDKWCQI